MIDFTNCKINNFKYYGGKNGGKECNKALLRIFPKINLENIKKIIYNTPFLSNI